jgi:pyruvate/2-oxoglutarate dehydrogenase complex dihydrolipoamide acyltransferase (E2) component
MNEAIHSTAVDNLAYVEAHTMAMLTTFNEVDMSAVQALRQQHQDAFQQRYGIKLGLMSFFVKTAIAALKEFPQLNAEVRGDGPVRDGLVVIRPIMYVALTYDHRIVDGRDAVLFLRRVKEVIENPARMLIEV